MYLRVLAFVLAIIIGFNHVEKIDDRIVVKRIVERACPKRTFRPTNSVIFLETTSMHTAIDDSGRSKIGMPGRSN